MLKKYIYQKLDKKLEKCKRDLFSNVFGDVLEIGAGFGSNIKYLEPRADSLTILEPNENHLNEAKKLFSVYKTKVVKGVGEKLPFPDDSFDTVVTTMCLCSVDNPYQAIREIKRVLRTNGSFLFIEHIANEENKIIKFIQKILRPIQWKISHCDIRRQTIDQIQEIGFEIIRLERVQGKVFWSITPVLYGIARIN